MIQDIRPRKLNNQYKQRNPEPNDYILHFDGRNVLCQQNEFLWVPSFIDLEQQNSSIYEDAIFLFSVDNKHYFLLNKLVYPKDSKFQYVDIQEFISLSKPHKGFAAVTAYQLNRWYDTHQYCGHCATKLKHSHKERMLFCEECGNMEYPKLAPAVIVGIRNKDKLLLTKYRGREYKRYALVAGFAEIGETIEETVQREVMEEVGLKVKNIQYYKSQPWGLTDTLLFGFYVDVDGDDTITLDNEELSIGEWVDRKDIEDDISNISLTGEMIQKFKDNKI